VPMSIIVMPSLTGGRVARVGRLGGDGRKLGYEPDSQHDGHAKSANQQ
jgi:hypothetical protein